MAGSVQLEVQKAQAIAEAIETTNGMLGDDSARLYSAKHDVVGSTDTGFVFAMLVAELARVAASQQERIERLEAGASAAEESKK